MSRLRSLRWPLAAFVASAALVAPSAALGATFDVTTENDGDTVADCQGAGTDCSLREAVLASNTDPGSDQINVPAGDYVLNPALGDIDISTAMTISGAGARTTAVDGDSATRLFQVTAGNIEIQDLTLQNGLTDSADTQNFAGDGGAILVNGSPRLRIRRSALVGNQADFGGGAIGVAVEDVETLAGRRAAPPVSIVKLQRSLVADNLVTGDSGDGAGGGVSASGRFVAKNSTLTDNTVGTEGAIGSFSQRGGAISILPETATGTYTRLINSTIVGNQVFSAAGPSFGGGIATGDVTTQTVSFESTNTIVAGNQLDDGLENCGGATAFTAAVTFNNLSDDDTCGFTDPDSIEADPELGGFADNGGPTDSFEPQADSPAIDAGRQASCPKLDQTGADRGPAKPCDIGSVERPTVGR